MNENNTANLATVVADSWRDGHPEAQPEKKAYIKYPAKFSASKRIKAAHKQSGKAAAGVPLKDFAISYSKLYPGDQLVEIWVENKWAAKTGTTPRKSGSFADVRSAAKLVRKAKVKVTGGKKKQQNGGN